MFSESILVRNDICAIVVNVKVMIVLNYISNICIFDQTGYCYKYIGGDWFDCVLDDVAK